MNREFKFRVWFNKERRMVDADAVSLLQDETLQIGYYDDSGCPKIRDEDSYTLMQYTGLEDKNDKEIYEGDIISRVGLDDIVVEWDYRLLITIQMDIHESGVEVLGNIYENPELLL